MTCQRSRGRSRRRAALFQREELKIAVRHIVAVHLKQPVPRARLEERILRHDAHQG
jgi:hypothetical protein